MSSFPSVTCVRRQLLHKKRPVQLAFLRFILYAMSISFLTVRSASLFFPRSAQLISVLLQHHIFKTSKMFLVYFHFRFQHLRKYAPNVAEITYIGTSGLSTGVEHDPSRPVIVRNKEWSCIKHLAVKSRRDIVLYLTCEQRCMR